MKEDSLHVLSVAQVLEDIGHLVGVSSAELSFVVDCAVAAGIASRTNCKPAPAELLRLVHAGGVSYGQHAVKAARCCV